MLLYLHINSLCYEVTDALLLWLTFALPCPAVIMSDEAVEQRRWKIKRKRLMAKPMLLSPQQQDLIEELLQAHNQTFDRTCSHFHQFRVSLPLLTLAMAYNASCQLFLFYGFL